MTKVRAVFMFEPELIARLKALSARLTGRPNVSALVRQAVEEFLERQKKKGGAR